MLSPTTLLISIAAYFGLISLIAWWSNRAKADSQDGYFRAGRKAPWLLVAIGMVGSSLSGLTFISVPGAVGKANMSYLQIVFGYMLGYVVIAHILLPLYYRLNLTSIYEYLGQRFGRNSYRTGAIYFLLSRSLGSAVRLYLAVTVLQAVIFDDLGIPYWLTTVLTMTFIVAYTFKGGIRTVIYTDALQTIVMVVAVLIALFALTEGLSIPDIFTKVGNSDFGQLFVWDVNADNYFWKHFLAGMFITIVMTGLDQDMMQKNLSISKIRKAQLNIYVYSVLIILVNFLFVGLGVLMYEYAADIGWNSATSPDTFFPLLALQQLGPVVSIAVVVGLIAAAYSSADGTLAALTTSTCVVLLQTEQKSEAEGIRIRHRVHIIWSVAFLLFIFLFRIASSENLSAIDLALKMAGYTYGPLLGLFAFGMISKRAVKDRWVPLLCILCPILCLLLSIYSQEIFNSDYKFGFELLLINGGLTMLGLWALSTRKPSLLQG